MMTDSVIGFLSRECKIGQHKNCYGKWQGLGFEINCDCLCGHKNGWILDRVEGPRANTNQDVQPLSMAGVLSQEND
jgi:hypothetical protein